MHFGGLGLVAADDQESARLGFGNADGEGFVDFLVDEAVFGCGVADDVAPNLVSLNNTLQQKENKLK